jgi:integral membrane sensor domain MASE1
VTIFASGLMGFVLPLLGAQLNLPLLPSGIAVAACYRWGRRMWPFVFAAVATVDFWHNHILLNPLGVGAGLIEAISVGAGLAGGAVFTTSFLERHGFSASFAHARDVPLFILSSAIGMTLMPTLGFSGYMLVGVHSEVSWATWFSWWGNVTAGVLIVGPMLIPMRRRSFARLYVGPGEERGSGSSATCRN